MPPRGPATQLLSCGHRRGGTIGRICAAVSFRVSAALVANGRPIVRGALLTGSPMYLDVRDPAHRDILWTGQTEPDTAAVLRRSVRTAWSVVDVGANAGYHSLLCQDLGASRVLAFEPNPRTAALLLRNAAGTTIEVIQAACGHTSGQSVLYVSPDPAKAAFATIREEVQWPDDGGWRPVSVPVVTVDDECDRRGVAPDLVKIDAEGAEEDVIRGMAKLLARRTPEALLCEVAAGWERPDPSDWIATVTQAGYTPATIGPGGLLSEFEGPLDRTVLNVWFSRTPG